jgi:hypothetical protein
MGRLSALPTETTFTSTDFVTKIKAAGGGDVKVLLPDFVKAISVPSLLRRAEMQRTADGANGATITQIEANEIQFTGTPTGYGRLNITVPMDYASGTAARIKLLVYSGNINNQAMIYYIGARKSGDAFTSWNVASNLTSAATLNLAANTMATFTYPDIASGNLSAGGFVGMATRPSAAITGNIWIVGAWLEYTAIL